MKKVLFTATVDSHILHFHIPYLKLFKENGYEVHVATNGDEEIPYCDVKHKISFERSPFKLNNLKAIKELKKVIDKEQFEIIHCHTPMGSVVTRIAAMKARKNGTRVIYTAHGFHFYKGAPILNWCLFYPIEKWLSAYTDTLITINREDYELAKRKFKKCKDIQYVPGVGIDENKFNVNMDENEKKILKKSLGLKEDDFVLTCVARLDKNKNQGFLIEVERELLKKYKNIHLLLVGPDELNGEYQEQAKNIKGNVHFLGFRKDISKILEITDVSLSSSSREGLPVNILEAICIGIPVVATNCRGNRDLITNGENGYLIEINDKENFVKTVESIYLNKANLMIEKSKQEAKKYTLTNILEEMKKIYFKRKRIIHLLASNDFSGAENVACTIIKETEDSFENFYCSPKGRIEEILEDKCIKYVGIDKLNYKNLKLILKEYNPDIIHAHDFRACFLSALTKENRILIEHIHKNSPKLKKISIYSLIFLYSSIKSKYILTVSKSIQREYIFSKIINKKIKCIGNPVSRENILRCIDNYDNKEDKEYAICCVARISKEKNPYKFLKVINEVKKVHDNIKVIWVGEGKLMKDVEKKAEELHLQNNVKFLGFKNNPYIYMKKSKIFLLTSDWEGFGLVAFEALTLGLPCIVSNVGGLPSIVDETCGKLCESIDDYVQIIIKLLSNAKLMNTYVDNAIKKSIKLNNLKKYINDIKNIYQK